MLSIPGHTFFKVNAQSKLTEKSVFKVEGDFVKDPAGNTGSADGVGVRLSPSAKYKVSIEFQFNGDTAEEEFNSFRRVQIFKPSPSIKRKCQEKECWVSLKQLSNNGDSLEFDLDEKTLKLGKILVSSWTPSDTAGRMGMPNKYVKVSPVKSGIKIEFDSYVGATFITIIPQ
jgi:hypothetical protein